LHITVAIAYRENGVLSNVKSLLFAMTHYNYLEMDMRQLKARQNLHMNIAIAYKENGVLSNVNQLKARQNLHMNVKIAYRENGVLSNMNNLLFVMMRYNYLETEMHKPRDDGIVEKWTQYVDSDRQSRRTTTHNFICVARMAKFYCRIFLQHHKSWKFF
jgi:hypothetical protein